MNDVATVLFPLAFAVIGALVYALTAHPKVSTLALYVFFCGFFWLTYELAGRALHLP